MSSDHTGRRDREDRRNEPRFHRLRDTPRPIGLPLSHDARVHQAITFTAARVQRLLAERPELAGQDWRAHFSRVITPESLPSYESMLDRAAFALLAVVAVDVRDEMDVTSGGDDEAA